MKFLSFILVMIFLPKYTFSEEYQLKIMGENNFNQIIVNDEKLVLAETDFKWSDSEANFGKGFCLGSINTILNKNTLNFLCEFLDFEGEKFWTKISRESNELSAGIGYQKYIKVTKKYKKFLNIECKYAVSWFDKTSFLMEQKCSL